MTNWLNVLAIAFSIAVSPLLLFWLLPLVSDLLILARRRTDTRAAPRENARLLFLVPAHNESFTIAPCVESLLAMRHSRAESEIVVVADNCTDDTAAIARTYGATVLERSDLTRRGKPPAIAWAMSQFDLTEYDAVVIIDADTVVDPGFADALAESGPLRDNAYQAYHDTWNPSGSWLSVLGELLAAVRYQGQYPAKARVGLNVPLTGNGMVLGTGLLARAGWVDESLTENWELYARYTELGEHIGFARGARLYAQEVQSIAQGAVQRRRWQAGRWIVFRDHLRPLISSRAIGWHQKIDTLGELAAPGPILQASLSVILAAVLFALPGMLAQVVGIGFLVALVPTLAWTARIWATHPRRGAIALAFLRLPPYMLWRMTIAILAIRTGRTGVWSRSPRHRPSVSEVR